LPGGFPDEFLDLFSSTIKEFEASVAITRLDQLGTVPFTDNGGIEAMSKAFGEYVFKLLRLKRGYLSFGPPKKMAQLL
jgi:hypothetical protein